MKKINTIVVLAFAALAACTTNPVTPTNLEAIKKPVVDAKKTQVLGVLEVEISSEQGSVSSAKFIAANSGLSAKGVAVPINSSNWVFTPGTTTFMTDATFKYLQNTITLENKTGSSFSNLTMYALNTPTNLGGTAFSNIKTLAGVPLTGVTADNVARAVMPTHGMSSVTTVDASKADMMVYTPAEVAAVQAQLVAPGFTMPSPKVLEYGFVARNFAGTARAIGTSAAGCPSGPTCNKAKITWAFKFPLSLPGSSTLGKFTMQYVVVNEPGTFATQSLEEQTAGTVAGLSTVASSSVADWRTLGGTGIHGAKVNPVCGAITATGPGPVFMGTTRVSGELDTCFATSGVHDRYSFSVTCSFLYGLLESLANPVVQSDGKIIMIGASNGRFGVVRLNRDGSADESFGTGGCARTGLPGIGSRYPYSVVIQPDGKIVVVGSVGYGGIRDWMLARFKTDGTLDDTFDGPNGNGNGQFEYNFGADEYASKVMLQTISGVTKLVVAGTSGTSGYGDHYTLVRLSMTDGSFDTSFNGTGINAEFIGGDLPNAAMDSSGRVVTAGYNLVRYNVNGTIDSSFGTNPVVSLGNATQSIDFTTIGGVEKIYAASAAYLYRLNSNASLDTTFNNPNGFICYYTCNNYQVSDVKVQSNNRVLLTLSNGQIRRLFADGSPDTAFGVNGISSIPSGGGLTLQNDGKFLNVGNDPTVGLSVSRFNP
jgi:uncharacterized delta-60 repeat protein